MSTAVTAPVQVWPVSPCMVVKEIQGTEYSGNDWTEMGVRDDRGPALERGERPAEPDARRHRLEADRDRPHHRSAEDGRPLCTAAAEGALPGRQGRARRQIRARR